MHIIPIGPPPRFSDRIRPLVHNSALPLHDRIKRAFETLKSDLQNTGVTTVEPNCLLLIETDESDIVTAATLNQNLRSVTFFSRTLSPGERRQSAVGKETYATVKFVRRWWPSSAGSSPHPGH